MHLTGLEKVGHRYLTYREIRKQNNTTNTTTVPSVSSWDQCLDICQHSRVETSQNVNEVGRGVVANQDCLISWVLNRTNYHAGRFLCCFI